MKVNIVFKAGPMDGARVEVEAPDRGALEVPFTAITFLAGCGAQRYELGGFFADARSAGAEFRWVEGAPCSA
jgi:hypothetical protein